MYVQSGHNYSSNSKKLYAKLYRTVHSQHNTTNSIPDTATTAYPKQFFFTFISWGVFIVHMRCGWFAGILHSQILLWNFAVTRTSPLCISVGLPVTAGWGSTGIIIYILHAHRKQHINNTKSPQCQLYAFIWSASATCD